jgi:Adaptor complexes medium subunit family
VLLPGNILRNDVVGVLKMKCFLSDMPECRLGLNDQLQDATFHQCVNLANYEAQKAVTFVPPDGEFELMRCAVSSTCMPLATA